MFTAIIIGVVAGFIVGVVIGWLDRELDPWSIVISPIVMMATGCIVGIFLVSIYNSMINGIV